MRKILLDEYTSMKQLADSIYKLHARARRFGVIGFLLGVATTVIAALILWLNMGGYDAITSFLNRVFSV